MLSTAHAVRRRVRRGLRRGQALDVGGARRRPRRAGDERPRPRRRHPRRRRRDDRLRPHQRPHRGAACAPPPRRRPRRRSQGGGGARTVALDPAAPAPRQHASSATPTSVPRPTKVELLRRIDEAARSAGAGDRPGVGRLRRQPQARARRQHRRRARRRRDRPRAAAHQRRRRRRHRHADRLPVDGPHRRLRDLRHGRRRGARPRRRPPGDHQARAPGRRRRARCRSSSSTAPAACCSTRRAATASRPTTSPRAPASTPARSASWSPRRSSRSSTTARWPASGARSAIDDEGHPTQRNVLIEDGVLTDYMWDYLRSRKEGRPPSGNGRRQSYMHLPMVRMTNTFVLDGTGRPGRHRRAPPTTACTSPSSAAAGQHGHRRLRVRHDRGLPHRERRDHRAAARGQPDRQRPAGAARHRHARQRLRDGQPGHVRQGRPGRAGRRRPADAAGEGADRSAAPRRDASTRRTAGDRRPGRRPGRGRASRSRPTCRAAARREVRVYEGEVEHFVVGAERGHRHPGDPRRPHRLRLRRHARRRRPIDEVLAEARDNVAFGTVDEWAGLAEPDGVAVTEQPLWNDDARRRTRPSARSSSPRSSSG